jgi:trigger factor
LEVKIIDITESEKELEVNFSYDEIKNDIETEVLKQTKNIQLPGFRKGKVPFTMLKKMYGDALEYEASEKVANSRFWQVSMEKELKPIGQPQLTDLKFNPGADLSFKVKFEVIPRLEVKDYTGLEIEVPKIEIGEEEIEHEIRHLLKANSITEDAELVGENNNFLINVEIKRIDENGNPAEGIKPETLDIDLSNERVNSDLVESARGKKAGEIFTFKFTGESSRKKEDGSEEIINEVLHYSGLINSVKKIQYPELNEEFIKKITKDKVSNENDLREEIKKDIEHYYAHRIDELVKDKLLQKIVQNNNFNPPQTMVSNILQELVKREEETAKKEGFRNFNKDEAEKRFKTLAELEVKWFLIKNAVQQKEMISVSEDELQSLAQKDAEKTGLPVEKLINYYKSSNYSDKVLEKKLFDFLKEKNIIKKVEPVKQETEEPK